MGKNYVDIEDDQGKTLRYRKHVNGRGLIANGAKVHATALVEAGAYVEPGVQIAEGAHIGRGAWIEPDAVIGRGAEIAPHAHIGSGAAIGSKAKIGVRTSRVTSVPALRRSRICSPDRPCDLAAALDSLYGRNPMSQAMSGL